MPVKWLNIKSSYSWIQAIQEDGDFLPLIPQNKIKADIRYQPSGVWEFNKLCFNFGSTYAFEKRDVSSDESFADAWFLLHTGVSTKIVAGNQLVTLSVRVNNLLNTSYLDHLSTLKGLGYYNMGRNVVVSVNIPLRIKTK